MFIHEIGIRYGRSKMDVTFKVNQLFKKEEEEKKSSWRVRSPSVGWFTYGCVCVSVRIGTLFKCHTKKSGKSDTKRCGGIKPQTGSSARRVLLYFFFPCGMPFCHILKYIL